MGVGGQRQRPDRLNPRKKSMSANAMIYMAVNSLYQSTPLKTRNACLVKLHMSSVTMLLQFLNDLRLDANSIIGKVDFKSEVIFPFLSFLLTFLAFICSAKLNSRK